MDEYGSRANVLRVSGSLGGKAGDLGKMKGAFVVKCRATYERPANLPISCKRVPQGYHKGATWIPKGC